MIVLLTIYRKCRYKSSISRVCFPVYPLSRINHGKYHTDIFLEVTNTTTCQTICSHLTKVAVYPLQLFLNCKLNSNQISMSIFVVLDKFQLIRMT